jgi:hypothetical protein
MHETVNDLELGFRRWLHPRATGAPSTKTSSTLWDQRAAWTRPLLKGDHSLLLLHHPSTQVTVVSRHSGALYYYLSTFIAPNVVYAWALSALLHSHSHNWLCYLGNTRVTATQFWCWSVISSFIQSGVILKSFSFNSFFTFCLPAFFISRSKSSLWIPNYRAYQDFFSVLMVEETGVPGGNHQCVIRVENPFYIVQHI